MRDLVAEVSSLEQQYANQGVSCYAKEGTVLQTSTETLQHVRSVLQAVADLQQHPERIHVIQAR